jgi:uncharacterized membrane protein
MFRRTTEGTRFALFRSVAGDQNTGASGSRTTERNIRTIARIEAEQHASRGLADSIGHYVSRFAGSLWFLALHALWFGGWIIANTQTARPFDPFPFTFLTFLLSLEAIFLSSFILLGQRHSESMASRRAALDLQINLLAEEEMTKTLAGIAAIARRMGISEISDDPENQDMIRKTDVETLAMAVDANEKQTASNDRPMVSPHSQHRDE